MQFKLIRLVLNAPRLIFIGNCLGIAICASALSVLIYEKNCKLHYQNYYSLYHELFIKKYDLPNSNDFINNMKIESKMRTLHKNLLLDGFVLPDFMTFKEDLQSDKKIVFLSLESMYNDLYLEKENINFDTFQVKFNSDENYRKSIYDDLELEKQDLSYEDFIVPFTMNKKDSDKVSGTYYIINKWNKEDTGMVLSITLLLLFFFSLIHSIKTTKEIKNSNALQMIKAIEKYEKENLYLKKKLELAKL